MTILEKDKKILHEKRPLNIRKNAKTLILVPDLTVPGGVANYYNSLQLNSLRNITYFTINKQESNSTTTTAFRLLKNYLIFIVKIIKDGNEVVVVNPSLYPRSFYRDFGFIFFTRLLKKKVIVFFHGWLDSFEEEIKNSKFKLLLFRMSYGKVSEFLVLGKIFKKKLISLGVSPNANFSIETMVAGSKALSDVDLKEKKLTYKKEIIFLFLSRIEKEKGIYIAIDAFDKFSNSSSKRRASLIIAGDGPDLSAVKLYVEKQRILNIKFLGHVSGEEKRNVLQQSHVMLFPSYTEGLPNAILEGMLYGMPIISRSTGAIPEIIHNGINGFLTESYTPSVFTNFLSLIALNTELYEEIGERNRKIALEKFLNENVRERLMKILQINES